MYHENMGSWVAAEEEAVDKHCAFGEDYLPISKRCIETVVH